MKELWLFTNIISLLLFALDKLKAKTGSRRTSNKVLKAILFLCPMGALTGMLVFRHKTQQLSFWLWGLAGGVAWGLLLHQLSKG